MDEIDKDDLAFVIHIGDILWYPCTDEVYAKRLAGFQRLRHPLIYTPGDNEWADCHEQNSGAYRPLERLDALRRLFFGNRNRSLGGSALALASQADDPAWPEFAENARWVHEGIVFVSINMPGSWNAGSRFDGRGPQDDAAAKRRTLAAVSWLERAFTHADRIAARGVVIATHADMLLESPADDRYRRSYEPLVQNLERLVTGSTRPVLFVHGDGHEYIVDQPLKDRRNGSILTALTRLETVGSPDVGWVRVTVTGDRRPEFVFRPRMVPWWRIW